MTNIDTFASTAGRQLARFCADESGATAIEYAMIASGIAVAIVAAVYTLGGTGEEPVHDGLRPAFLKLTRRLSRPPEFPACAAHRRAASCAEPGFSGCCWLSCGAQPDSQTISKVARTRPSGSAKRSA